MIFKLRYDQIYQMKTTYINTTPLIVVSCSPNVRRNSVHSTGDSSLFDQNNCPIRVLKREKKVSSQIASAYTSSLMLLLVAEKNLIGVKSGQNPPQFYLQLVCNSHLITWILLIGQLEHIVTVASWSIANNFVIDFYCRCLEIFMPNCNKL